VRDDLEHVVALAAELGVWVVLGSAHPLTSPRWPRNSLSVVSDRGELVTRYDKRIVSHTEVTRFSTPGSEAVVFEIDGYRFGCVICVEINFPELLIDYARRDVDCLLVSAYPVDAIFDVKARAYAALHRCWVSLATPVETASFIRSALIGPDGVALARAVGERALVVADLDPAAPELEIALTRAKPWRASVATDPACVPAVSTTRAASTAPASS
jgi:predicted amidohydrolase